MTAPAWVLLAAGVLALAGVIARLVGHIGDAAWIQRVQTLGR